MNTRTSLVCVATVVAAMGVLWTGSYVCSSERAPGVGQRTSNDFTGKIVHVQTTTGSSFVLENVKVIEFCGQWFFSGTGIKEYADMWWEGVPVRINFASVVSYSPMKVEEYEQTIGKRSE